MSNGRFDHFLARLAGDPAIFPHQFDLMQDRVLLVNLPVAAQSAAAFLDERALTPGIEGAWFSWRHLQQAAATVSAGDISYILHVGHCGSTLLSRLIGAASGARQLREPLPLRTFAYESANALDGAALMTAGARGEHLDLFERLWGRNGGAVVKATSACCNLIDEVRPGAPVAFVFIKPEIYLTKVLGGEGARFDLRNFSQLFFRSLRKSTQAIGNLSALSPGEVAAMSWLVETSSIAASTRPVHAVDFDKFLADPAPALARLCDHLGRPAPADAINRSLASDIMRQYSKLPAHAYDASVRSQILKEDQARFKDEIASAMKWLHRVARAFPAGEKALQRFS